MKLEPRCPLCKGYDFKPHPSIPDAYKDVPWHLCFCGYAFQITDVTMDDMAEYYEEKYRADATDGAGDYPRPWDITIQTMRAFRQMHTFGSVKPPQPASVLDIGCANGVLLEHCRLLWGAHVAGVEHNAKDHELLEKRGIPWYTDIGDVPGSFDLITMSHVLEHFDRPVEFLQRLADERAAPNGWLLVELPLPDAESAYAKYHYGVYTREALARTLTLGGWIPKAAVDVTKGVQQIVGRLP